MTRRGSADPRRCKRRGGRPVAARPRARSPLRPCAGTLPSAGRARRKAARDVGAGFRSSLGSGIAPSTSACRRSRSAGLAPRADCRCSGRSGLVTPRGANARPHRGACRRSCASWASAVAERLRIQAVTRRSSGRRAIGRRIEAPVSAAERPQSSRRPGERLLGIGDRRHRPGAPPIHGASPRGRLPRARAERAARVRSVADQASRQAAAAAPAAARRLRFSPPGLLSSALGAVGYARSGPRFTAGGRPRTARHWRSGLARGRPRECAAMRILDRAPGRGGRRRRGPDHRRPQRHPESRPSRRCAMRAWPICWRSPACIWGWSPAWFSSRVRAPPGDPAARPCAPIKKWAAVVARWWGGFAYLLPGRRDHPHPARLRHGGLVAAGGDAGPPAISLRLVAWAALMVLLVAPESLLECQLPDVLRGGDRPGRGLRAGRPAPGGGRGRRTSATGAPGPLSGLALLLDSPAVIARALATAPFAIFHFNRLAASGCSPTWRCPRTAFWIMPCGDAGRAADALRPGGLALRPWAGASRLVLAPRPSSPAGPGAGRRWRQECRSGAWSAALLGGLWLCLWREPWRDPGACRRSPALLLAALVCDAGPPRPAVSGDGRSPPASIGCPGAGRSAGSPKSTTRAVAGAMARLRTASWPVARRAPTALDRGSDTCSAVLAARPAGRRVDRGRTGDRR